MAINIVDRLKFKDSRLGYVKVDDGSTIILRVAIVDVKLREEASPFGVEFDVNATAGIAIYPSESVLNEIKDKPVLEPDRTVNTVKEGWIKVNIAERAPSYEEVIYSDGKIGKYSVRVEIEPIMVSKNTLYKTLRGLPLYVVRWVPKITWSEMREGSEEK